MEAIKDSQKSKERLLTFLLIFLVLLIPVSVFSSMDRALVEVTNVQEKDVDNATSNLFLTLRNRINAEVDCNLEVTYLKENQIFRKDIQGFGHILPKQSKVGVVVINFPGENFDFQIEPKCIKLS